MTTTLGRPIPVATPYMWRWPALGVILVGSMMELLDATATGIAGPTIQSDVGGGPSTIQWLGVGYTLAMVAGLLTGGRMGDIAGRKRMFVIGAGGFVFGSLLCGVASSAEMIIAARVLQGLFGAMMIPQGLGMLKEMFPPKELQTAFGAMGPVIGLSAIGGPILAGWLVSADLFGTGWRMIFLINLPIGLAAILGAIVFLPPGGRDATVRLDLPGAALASIGFLLVVYPLVQGREHGWPAWSFAMMAASVVVFAIFGLQQVRTSAKGRDPLVEPSLFRKRGFQGGLITGTTFFCAFAGFGLVFNLYIQLELGYSPLKAALSGIPLSIGMMAGMGTAQKLSKHGRRVLHCGILLMAVGIVMLLSILHPAASPAQMTPALLTIGLGAGMTTAPFFNLVLAGVDNHETGSASGALTAMQQVGGALGVALLGTVFFGSVSRSSTIVAQAAFWPIVAMLGLTFLAGLLLPRHVPDNPTPRPFRADHQLTGHADVPGVA